MTMRTVVRDGLIVINTYGEIPDGTPVEVVRTPTPNGPTRKASRDSKRTSSKKTKRSSDPLDGLVGFWKNRPDWKGKTTLQIANELREKALGRPRRV